MVQNPPHSRSQAGWGNCWALLPLPAWKALPRTVAPASAPLVCGTVEQLRVLMTYWGRLPPAVHAPTTAPTTEATTAPTTQPVNMYCAVMRDEKVDPEVTITYQDQTIAFCCKECIETFNEDPEKHMQDLK